MLGVVFSTVVGVQLCDGSSGVVKAVTTVTVVTQKKEPPEGVSVRGFGQEHRPERKKPMRLCRILPQAASACDKLSKCPPVPPAERDGEDR